MDGWVFWVFHCLPNSAWADGNLAELAGQQGKMVEHPNQSQPNPGPRPPNSPCSKTTRPMGERVETLSSAAAALISLVGSRRRRNCRDIVRHADPPPFLPSLFLSSHRRTAGYFCTFPELNGRSNLVPKVGKCGGPVRVRRMRSARREGESAQQQPDGQQGIRMLLLYGSVSAGA